MSNCCKCNMIRSKEPPTTNPKKITVSSVVITKKEACSSLCRFSDSSVVVTVLIPVQVQVSGRHGLGKWTSFVEWTDVEDPGARQSTRFKLMNGALKANSAVHNFCATVSTQPGPRPPFPSKTPGDAPADAAPCPGGTLTPDPRRSFTRAAFCAIFLHKSSPSFRAAL